MSRRTDGHIDAWELENRTTAFKAYETAHAELQAARVEIAALRLKLARAKAALSEDHPAVALLQAHRGLVDAGKFDAAEALLRAWDGRVDMAMGSPEP